MTGKRLQIVLTTGAQDPERAAFALNTALVAASAGVEVSVFLAMKAPEWACRGGEQVEGGAQVSEVLHQLIGAGVQIEACSVCFDKFCSGGSVPELKDEIRLAGMLTFVRRTMDGVETLTF